MKQTIEEGAYVLLTVKYGLIRLVSTKADLCEQIGNVDLECPVKAGDLEITKTVDLPNEIPPVCSTLILHLGCSLTRISRANTPCWLTSSLPMMFRSPA